MQPKRKVTKTTHATLTAVARHIRRLRYSRGSCCHAGVVCSHLEVLAAYEDLGDRRGPSAEFTLTFQSAPFNGCPDRWPAAATQATLWYTHAIYLMYATVQPWFILTSCDWLTYDMRRCHVCSGVCDVTFLSSVRPKGARRQIVSGLSLIQTEEKWKPTVCVD